MKVWVFVEGPSDRTALSALWAAWIESLRRNGWGIAFIPLDDKARFLKKIGPRAAEKLVYDDRDLVIGLPDLYPNRPFDGTEHAHETLEDLQRHQTELVKRALRDVFGVNEPTRYLSRFFPSALKHDLEVLLLAARTQLRDRLKTTERLTGWRVPPEDQNQDRPPKRIVEELFRTRLGRCYRDTVDAPAILRCVELRDVLFDEQGREQCPVFKTLVDWIGERTGVPGYC